MRKRAEIRSKIGWKFEETLDNVCLYCGLPGDTWDHALPYSHRLEAAARTRLVITSCRECNSLLSNSLQETLGERVVEAKRRLRRKYKKLLSRPTWGVEELMELGEGLRLEIYREEALKKLVQARLDFDYFTWIRVGAPRHLLPLG